MFSTLMASTQWQLVNSDADELKGTSASSYIAVKIPGKGIITLDNDKDVFSFTTFTGIFSYERYRSNIKVVEGLFGMYDEIGKLVGKEKIMLYVFDESPDFAVANSESRLFPRDNFNGIIKVASWIRESKGSVRFVIPIYGRIIGTGSLILQ